MKPQARSEPAPATPPPDGRVESARYALLRRLAPSMRHHLVVNLQPIGMIYEVMDRRLRADPPDLAEVHDSAHKINGFAKAALASSLDVITWLAPDGQATTSPAEGVRECLSLLATSLTFRGFALRNEAPTLAGQVRRAAIRNALTAALLHASDTFSPPGELVLSAAAEPDALVLSLHFRASEGQGGFAPEAPYRVITWTDLQALAGAESVGVSHDQHNLRLAIPWDRDPAA